VFDYVDPGSYLAAQLLRRAGASRGSRFAIDWQPLELRPPPSARIDPSSPAWAALAGTAAGAASAAGVPFRVPTFVPWTRKAHELSFLAREKGCFDAVHQTLFEAHFVRGMDIGRIDVLAVLAEEEGLQRAEARAALGVDRFGPTIQGIRTALLREGVPGVPFLQANGRTLAGFQTAAELDAFFIGL
jgi:predicted DsbA family dithiol-disulfide isomerase